MLDTLSGIEIAHRFIEDHGRQFNVQTADGIMQRKDSEEYGYDYVWVMATVDLDYLMYYLLDVRTAHSDNSDETRDFLFVASGPSGVQCCWHNQPIQFSASADDHSDRLHAGLTWLAGQIQDSDLV